MGLIDELKFELEELKSCFMTITRPPKGTKITRWDFWEDATGNIRYMKALDGNKPLFTLEFNDAGAATTVTWSIIRS